MLREDQKERLCALGDEQLAIAEKWEREKEERSKIFDELIAISKSTDLDKFKEVVDKLAERQPTHCEHERSIWSSCAGCDEIERALAPEFYDENGDRLEDDAIEAIVNANPERYGD